ncbi:S-layer homology domain-containing protein [Mitsuokella sp. AF21-1AC]|uniref:S-layer homology domain-containing protein n=1 Tax=Mitsuokella sp. AF21-1AC TaxID=2292235 RepID=UPI000E4C257F|nr:S-layer homology domain-containing protein [Mitsuokella sp. AF21-1AC]RGS71067.1 S-layer protein [Mitsuokella sp. AF21-1AC]
MKKTLVSALTTALVVGAASTTFAAANPFSDVPADHWAYDAVSQLAADGVIEGYGDTTFRGNQNITRYEMAQMIAKAMAKSDVSAADKALIDKLAAEFSDELNNLGVRVSNLERNADMVKWNGKAEYTYKSIRTEHAKDNGKDRSNSDKLKFRLEPTAEVNSNWHVKARLDATTHMNKDAGVDDSDQVKLQRVYAQGDYGNFQTQLGKFGLYTPEQGLVFDDELSGANVTFGKDLKATLYAGRLNVSDDKGLYNKIKNADDKVIFNDDAANFQGITLQYASPASKWTGGAAYYHLNSDGFKGVTDSFNKGEAYTNGKNDEDNANIWSANLGYNFDNTSRLFAAYANNTTADNLDKSWQVIYNYKGAQAANKGSWGAYAAYRYLGTYTSVFGTEDAQKVGAKGWEVGMNYTPFKNVVALAKYFNGKSIDSDRDVDTLWGRVQFLF